MIMKRLELKMGDPQDNPASALSRMLAEQKIDQAMMKLGLTFAECVGIIGYDPEIETACWCYDKVTGRERIVIGWKIAALSLSAIEIALRHELLHRSIYHSFAELYPDEEVANIAQDICINQLLYQAYPKSMRLLSEGIYPEESKKTIIALADCTADPCLLEPEVSRIWHDVWNPDMNDRLPVLNMASLYFRLVRFRPEIILAARLNPFPNPHKSGLPGIPADDINRACRKSVEDLNRHLSYSCGTGRDMAQYSVVPMDIGSSAIDAFLQKLRVKRRIDEFAEKVLEPFRDSTTIQFYPGIPSRLGLIYQALGLTDIFHVFWNRDFAMHGARMAIGIYLDVSGSMFEFFPLIVHLADSLKEVSLELFAFDTDIHEINMEQIKHGTLEGGGGTDFDAPVAHFLNDSELAAAVLITDGCAEISRGLEARLNHVRASRKLYMVYITADKEEWNTQGSPLDRVASDSMILSVERSNLGLLHEGFVMEDCR